MKTVGTLLLLLVALAIFMGSSAFAQDSSVLWRFYYSHAVNSEIERSPADPDGDFITTAPKTADKGVLEMILFRRAGISVTRQTVLRELDLTSGLEATEDWTQYMASLTLYAFEVKHNSFNIFIGAGAGAVERYNLRIGGQTQPVPGIHKNMPLTTQFGGLEYSFERIGLRLEIARVNAEKSSDTATAEIDQIYQFVTILIPLN